MTLTPDRAAQAVTFGALAEIACAAAELGNRLTAWSASTGRDDEPLRGVAAQLTEPGLLAALDALGRSRSALERIEVELVREGLDRGLPRSNALSPVNWVRTTEGATAAPPDAAQAARTVRLATAANKGPDAATERLLQTCYAGGLSPDKTDLVVRFVEDVDAVTDPDQLVQVVEALRAGSVDGPDPLSRSDDLAEADKPWMPVVPTWVTGMAPSADGTRPGIDGQPASGPAGWGLSSRDLRTAIRQTRRMLKSTDRLEEEEAVARRGRALHSRPGPGGLTDYHLSLDAEGAAIIDTAVAALSKPVLGPDGSPDPRRAAHRRADALLQVVQRGLDAAGSAPGESKTQIVVTIPYQDLLAETRGAGITSTGQVLSPETVRRWACDARILPMVLDGAGQPLDLGRGKRFFTDGQHLAVFQRDRGCTFPGCSLPPEWCDAHHLIPWAEGGLTDLINAALLCRLHHTYVHDRRLTATVTATGVRWNLTT